MRTRYVPLSFASVSKLLQVQRAEDGQEMPEDEGRERPEKKYKVFSFVTSSNINLFL